MLSTENGVLELHDKMGKEPKNEAVLNKPLSFVIVMVGIAFAVLNLQLVLGGDQTSLWQMMLYGALAFLSIFVVMFWVFDSKSTVVNEDFIAKGKTKIYWQDVTATKSNDFSIVITSGDKKAVINYYAYSNPEHLMARIHHLLGKRT
ncbi:hypothetical protein [Enterovibrio sp. 27052020O]|uniref:hypothetical protein n=1 Tax=Enterovibrio sp. 27052020O TaxID=3241166 RepID=UPI0038902771